MDVGPEMKAFQVIWNKPVKRLDILIHNGEFHCMLMFFLPAIGSYLKGSGFEEIIFLPKLCTSGCIKVIMNEKHYSRFG